MSPIKKTLSVFAAISISFGAIAPRAALAQPERKTNDTVAAALASAHKTYESAMQGVRADIDRAVKKKLDAATKPGAVDNEALDAARAEKLAFEAEGKWPEGTDSERARGRAAAAAQALLGAYGRAVAAYTKEGNEPLAQAIIQERKAFENRCDLTPWGPNLVKDKPDAERTLSSEGPELTVEATLPEGYRVEVTAKRNGDAGWLIVGVPLGHGERLPVSSLADKDGIIHLLLSVRTDGISADLGAARPVELSKAVAGKGLTLRSQDGPILIESIRLKPILTGGPEAVAAKQKPDPKSKPKLDDPNDRYVAGKTWRGRNKDGGMSTIKLTSRNGDRVEFELPGSFAGSLWRIGGRLRGGVVAVDDMDRIRNPAGHPAVKVTGPGGSIRINSNGTLDLHASGRLSGGDRQNLPAEFDFNHAEPG